MLQTKFVHLLYMLNLALLVTTTTARAQIWNPSHSVGPLAGKYLYQIGQTPDQLVEIYPATIFSTSLQYQWFSCSTPKEEDFQPVANATQSSYSPDPISATIYYRRRTTNVSSGQSIFSNIIKLTVVSADWEDRNYIREYNVQVTGITSQQALDQLTIGQKVQTTTYLDGLGRTVQSISRETATPASPGGLWADVVQFSEYDELGRQAKNYLPYCTTTESGKFKSAPLTEQMQYHVNVYNETSAYSEITFEANPLDKHATLKDAGTKWAASNGRSLEYDMNNADENVQIFAINYTRGSAPVNKGAYAAKALHKRTYIERSDVKERKVIEYYDKDGRLILKKIQQDDVPSAAHSGWICTYSVYDGLNVHRCQIQPEAVKYLDTHGWSFAGTEGQQVLNGQCYQYFYDNKGRVICQKSPDSDPLNMLYDDRDRIVFSQDGNQAALPTPQWTAYLYDELDRPVITALYNTTKTIAALQSDIANAVTITGNIAYTSAIPVSDLNNAAITTITKYQYYDDYTFASAKPFNNGFTNTSAYSTSDPNVMPIAPTKRTLSLPTGTRVRVLGSNTFLANTLYYDEKERVIQSLEDNVKAGTDINTWQYHFDGRMLSLCSDHTTAGTGYTNFITLTRNNFDKLGRITSVEKQFGSNAFKTVATYEFDDVGRLKTKRLDPGYAAGGNSELESLAYTYNIHGQIIGINKDYALKNPSNYNKWGHFFGMYLGYDNRDNVFSQSRLSGLLTGVLWNTQGDDAQRKYDYTYDNANRLTNADFTEQKHPGDGWSNGKMDFSVNGNGGKITYDANGNLMSLLRKGVIPGTAAPVVIDDLAYTYETHSNKLQTVTDNTTLSSSLNGKQGDFKDGTNGTADYVYDHNGNLVIDLNKNIKELENVAGADGISYNYLGKPEKIRIAGKGTVRMVYNANGNKLQRAFIPENGDPATIITYISEFVYQQTGSLTTNTVAPFMQTGGSLSYISFEEGRIRAIEPITVNNNNLDGLQIGGNITLPNGKEGVFDYFIRDYQSSVRMILTEEVHTALNTCTMENGRSTAEEPVFGQTGGANEVVSTRYPAGPTNWQNSNIGSSVSQLGNIAGHNIGPNTLQKVMAGDKVSAYVDYYYQAATGGDNMNIVANVLTSLGQAIIGGGAATDLVKSNVAPINNQLNGANGFLQAVHPSSDGTNTPRAYLTALFFDERFNFIEAADGGVMQQQVAASITDAGSQLSWGNIKAPKNGYVYVYVSNQSDQDVYFDNMKVGITRGNIIEENHYYAYGMKIAAISSQKPGHVNEGVLNNNFKYQGGFGEMDDDLGWNDFEYRTYDVQIGRWLQIDPLDKFTSPYSGMDNDPVNNIDPDGADPLPVPFIWKIPDAIAKGVSTGASVASTISKVTITGGKTAAGIVRVAKVVNNTVSIAARVSQTSARLTTPNVTVPPYLQNAGPGPVKLDSKFAFQKGINGDNLTQTSIITLNYIMSQVKVKKLTISSTGRGPVKQVDLMFHQQESKKPISYKAPGDAVMNVYRKMKGTKATDTEIKKAMLAECYKQGPGNVSGHCADPADQNAIDFGNNSLAADLTLEEKERFRTILQGMRDKGWLSNFLTPENTGGTEPAFHIQIKNKDRLIGTGSPGQYNTIAPWSNFGTQRPNWVSWP